MKQSMTVPLRYFRHFCVWLDKRAAASALFVDELQHVKLLLMAKDGV